MTTPDQKPTKLPALPSLASPNDALMKHFAKEPPEVKLKALRWILAPYLLYAAGFLLLVLLFWWVRLA